MLLSDLATKRLTLTTETVGAFPNVVVRLAGTEIARPLAGNSTISGYTPAVGDPFSLTVSMDGAPAAGSGGTDGIISATYNGCIVGGYYLLASGGETSNWTQVHRAAQQLLTSNQSYKIVFNSAESGCDVTSGLNCTPYVDANGNGYDATDLKLIDNKPAMDDHTGGLLYVAAMQYYAKLRDDMARADALNHVRTPIDGYLGVVSSTHDVGYIDGTAFSVLPGGLLIDMKGITISGSWRIDQPAAVSNSQFQFIGHIVSSLEHETWQELTGYDAVSTVRGIQMALSNGASLLDLIKNNSTDTVQSMYTPMGFGSAAPSGFTLNRRTIYSSLMDSWSYATSDSTKSFMLMKKQPANSSDSRLSRMIYYNDYLDGNLNCFYSTQNQLQSLKNTYGGSRTLNAGSLCISTYSAGTTIDQAIALNQSDYSTFRTSYVGATAFDYLDENKGFATSSFAFRGVNGLAANSQPSSSVSIWRNILYLQDLTKGWNEIVVPSQMTTGSNYAFSVDILKTYDTSSNLTSATFEILNETGIAAGGGYVPPKGTLLQQATSISLTGSSNGVPTFNNAVFTNKLNISLSNNDTVKTPSTADPVSTITGNNYHDETDFTIKGRGLNIAFTRTYNSGPASTKSDGPFGYGWTHSYNMKLKSNDFGVCPNCTTAQKPENGDGKTSSITYTDERGGEHNYLVDSTTYAVTPPTGEYETLALDTPSAGYYTLTFRNGVTYVFQGTNLKTTPGNSAKLTQIADPYGNQLNFGYDGGGNLTSVTDNLGLSGRTGLTITYYPGTIHVKDVTDWTGRKYSYAYDGYNNLQSVTNPIPTTIQYGYTPGSHNLNSVTLPETRNGQAVTTSFQYYKNGKTFNYANSLGDTETMDYDLYRKSTQVTDPRGFIREYEYDSNGLMTKLTEPDGAVLMFDNTTDLMRYKKTDGLGYATTYSYRTDFAATGASNTGGNVTQEKDPLNNTLQYGYGVYDQAATLKDKNGNARTMAYYTSSNPATGAVAGKLQSITLGSLNGTANLLLKTFTYNPDGTPWQVVEQIDPANSSRKRVATYAWQNNGLNLQSVTVSGSGLSRQTTYGYDNLGRKTSETVWRRTSPSDATLIGLTTFYIYDALDRVTQVTDPLGNYIETVYDGDGKIYQIKGHYKKPDATFDVRTISTRSYDAADRLATDTDIYGNVTQYAYDQAGNLIQVTDANGHVTKYEYDPMGRRTAVIDANGYKSQTVYNAAGHPTQVVNPLGKTTTTAYDALGRATTVTDPLGYQTTFGYDNNGNLTKMTDANANAGLQPKNSYGATVYKIYDELNRVKSETDALNGVTSYTYDLLGDITSVTDANGHTTYFDYNDMGRLTTVRDPLYPSTNKATTFTYYETGEVLTRTKRSGATATYTLDALNRVTQADYSSTAGNITETTVFDIYGNKYTVSNPDVLYSYAYDLKNRPTLKMDGRQGKTLQYTYDNVGNVLTKTNYDGSVTEYRYDDADKLVAERNRSFLEVSYQYDGAGRLLNRILSNGAMTSYNWDDGNLLAGFVNKSAVGTTVNSTTYIRDRLGNITSQTDASGTTSFTYDALYRLTNADYPGTANDQNFTYDKVGNRSTFTKNGSTFAYVYDVDNRLKEIHLGTTTGPLQNSYVYDDDGNTTAKKNGYGTTMQSLAFDAKGRVSRVGSYNLNSFKYDPYDYRIYKSDSQGAQNYLLEGEHLEAVMNSGSGWVAKYMRGVVIDEVVNGFQTDPQGKWTNYTFHHDNQQSVLGLSGHEGSVLQTIQYGPFGNKFFPTTGTDNNNYLHFTGREEDGDSGLYYFRARYYDPWLGRFITEDPKGFDAGVNFYVYANNNPINANDPYGLDAKSWWLKDFISKQAAELALKTARNAAVRDAWAMEQQLVKNGYDGTRWWTALEKNELIETGKVAGYEGHHINSVKPNVNIELARNPDNIAFADRNGHFDLHDGNWRNATEGQLLDRTANGALPRLGSTDGLSLSKVGSYVLGGLATVLGVLDWADPVSAFMTVSSPRPVGEGSDIVPRTNLNLDMSGLGTGAAGGFVIYPNKANLNMIRSVYSK